MNVSTSSDPALILANRYLPSFQFSEKHGIASVKASAGAILAAAKGYDDRRDRIVNFLQTVREIPARLAAALGSRNALLRAGRFLPA